MPNPASRRRTAKPIGGAVTRTLCATYEVNRPCFDPAYASKPALHSRLTALQPLDLEHCLVAFDLCAVSRVRSDVFALAHQPRLISAQMLGRLDFETAPGMRQRGIFTVLASFLRNFGHDPGELLTHDPELLGTVEFGFELTARVPGKGLDPNQRPSADRDVTMTVALIAIGIGNVHPPDVGEITETELILAPAPHDFDTLLRRHVVRQLHDKVEHDFCVGTGSAVQVFDEAERGAYFCSRLADVGAEQLHAIQPFGVLGIGDVAYKPARTAIARVLRAEIAGREVDPASPLSIKHRATIGGKPACV